MARLKDTLPRCPQCNKYVLTEHELCFTCKAQQVAAEKAAVIDAYQQLLTIKDELTREVMLRAFAQEHFPALLKLPSES